MTSKKLHKKELLFTLYVRNMRLLIYSKFKIHNKLS